MNKLGNHKASQKKRSRQDRFFCEAQNYFLFGAMRHFS